MGKTFNGYRAGECCAFLLTLPIKLSFALVKCVVKIIIRETKNHKQNKQNKTQTKKNKRLQRQ